MFIFVALRFIAENGDSSQLKYIDNIDKVHNLTNTAYINKYVCLKMGVCVLCVVSVFAGIRGGGGKEGNYILDVSVFFVSVYIFECFFYSFPMQVSVGYMQGYSYFI